MRTGSKTGHHSSEVIDDWCSLGATAVSAVLPLCPHRSDTVSRAGFSHIPLNGDMDDEMGWDRLCRYCSKDEFYDGNDISDENDISNDDTG